MRTSPMVFDKSSTKKEVSMPNFTAWRPDSFADFEGQDALKRQIKTELAASRQLMRPLPSMCFWGPPGLGKTTLAAILAKECDVPLIKVIAEGLTHDDLAYILVEDFYHRGFRKGYDNRGVLVEPAKAVFPIVLIDEAEKLSRGLMELLHSILEPDNPNGVMTFQVKDPQTGRICTAWVPRFTMIWNTNFLGDIVAKSKATLSRFKIVEQFQFYTDDQSYRVVFKQAQANKLAITEEAARLIAARSNGIPRTICNLLERSVSNMVVAGEEAITESVIESLLADLGIDTNGLDPAMRQYLQLLADAPSGKLSVQALASMLCSDSKTLEHVVEPPLMAKKMVARGGGGRTLMPAGRAILGQETSFDIYQSVCLS